MLYILAFAMTACVAPPVRTASDKDGEESITLSVRTRFWLNRDELLATQDLALAGDLQASYCIATYYSYSADLDDPDRLYWILIAAENGEAGAMMMISLEFEMAEGQRERDRAKYWRKRAEATRSQPDVDCHRLGR